MKLIESELFLNQFPEKPLAALQDVFCQILGYTTFGIGKVQVESPPISML
jgi:hypothetical protein